MASAVTASSAPFARLRATRVGHLQLSPVPALLVVLRLPESRRKSFYFMYICHDHCHLGQNYLSRTRSDRFSRAAITSR